MSDQTDNNELFPFASSFDDILQNIASVKTSITQLTMQLKNLEKDVKKKMKAYDKLNNKPKKGNRKPSGFAEPVQVSKELQSFMKLSDGDKVARTEVTKYLSSYIKQHNLKSQENGSVIVPNEELGNLLGAKEDETITFFNLQRFMNKHFISHSLENVV